MKRYHILLICLTICSAIPSRAEVHLINDLFTISVSNNLELRLQDNADAQSWVVFQQKDESSRSLKNQDRICQIMISTYSNGECPYCTDGDFTPEDVEKYRRLAYSAIAPGQVLTSQPVATIETSDHGMKYIKVYYERSAMKGEVCVNMCFFYNYDQAAIIIAQYHKSDGRRWKSAISETISSFNWRDPYTHFYSDYEYIDQKSDDFAIIRNSKSEERQKAFNTWIYVISAILATAIIGVGAYFLTRYIVCELESRRTEKKKNRKDKRSSRQGSSQQSAAIGSAVQPSIATETAEAVPVQQPAKTSSVQVAAIQTPAAQISPVQQPTVQDVVTVQEPMLQRPAAVPYPAVPRSRAAQQGASYGIPRQQGVVRVRYAAPSEVHTEEDFYFDLLFPTEGSVVFPYRQSSSKLRSSTEIAFENELRNALAPLSNYMVAGDAVIAPDNGCRKYETDIAIVEKTPYYGMRIDLEIDEPYSAIDNRPTHYVGCGDEYRDRNLVNNGWIVLRFSERQIMEETDKCISLVRYIISVIDSSIDEEYFLAPKPDRHWSLIDAQKMQIRRYREQLSSPDSGNGNLSGNDVQTELERQTAQQVEPLNLPRKTYVNLDGSNLTFGNDSLLSYEPGERIYVYNDSCQLTSATEKINRFFMPDDTLGMSSATAARTGKDQCEIIEEWDAGHAEENELSLFLRNQIDAYLNNQPVCYQTQFRYNGEFVSKDAVISIETEMKHFERFIEDTRVKPFRVNWHIFDQEHGIAGTVHLVCRNGKSYDLYELQRSAKTSPDEPVWNHGINGLNNVPDITFYRIALKQNINRYILEHNYGITVKNMYVVALHPQFKSYMKYRIPDMASDIETILR